MSNTQNNPTETGVKCLSTIQIETKPCQQQETAAAEESFFEFEPTPETVETVEPCRDCGKPATVQYEFRRHLETTTYHLNADNEWEYVDNGTDDGEPDGCWYFCEKCSGE